MRETRPRGRASPQGWEGDDAPALPNFNCDRARSSVGSTAPAAATSTCARTGTAAAGSSPAAAVARRGAAGAAAAGLAAGALLLMAHAGRRLGECRSRQHENERRGERRAFGRSHHECFPVFEFCRAVCATLTMTSSGQPARRRAVPALVVKTRGALVPCKSRLEGDASGRIGGRAVARASFVRMISVPACAAESRRHWRP